jgi:hypothetical protein
MIMKRAISVCALALCSALVFGQSARVVSLPLDFDVTLADLHRAAQSGDDREIPSGRWIVLDATVGSVTVRSDTDAEFVAEVELVEGEWIGDDRVELLRAYAVFEGHSFKPYFSRTSPDRLQPGDHILLLSTYLGIGVDYDETTPVAVVEGVSLRIMN